MRLRKLIRHAVPEAGEDCGGINGAVQAVKVLLLL